MSYKEEREEWIEAQRRRVQALPVNRSLVIRTRRQAKDLLEAHANGELELTPSQMRAAIALLPFQTPKLAVTAHVDGGNFGEKLDRALARSFPRPSVRLIEHRPESEGDADDR